MKHDLTVSLAEGKLNIRVAAWLEQGDQILVSRYPNGLLSLPGGRLKFDESSEAGIRREIFEELHQEITELHLLAVVENFFELEQHNFHELLFIYRGKVAYQEEYLNADPREQTILWLPIDQLDLLKPAVLQELVDYQGSEILHLINRDN